MYIYIYLSMIIYVLYIWSQSAVRTPPMVWFFQTGYPPATPRLPPGYPPDGGPPSPVAQHPVTQYQVSVQVRGKIL